ncbi:monocarboxylate transporter 10-like [Lineus longissimus]|uniref:monocarboxylate transporter 10-like n=1 Tax=Lineus longissimus TaxID=88925 RepID=UPI002B4EDE49
MTFGKKKKEEASTEVNEPLQKGVKKKEQPQRNPGDPPDGGWGWLVCIGSSWTNGTVFGVINTFGILFVEMLKLVTKEGEDHADARFKTSWVGSVTVGCIFFLAPVSSILVDRFGIRKTAFSGAVIAFIGMLSSSFVQEIELLYLTYGVLLGAGCSLVYTPSLIILGHYFQRRLGLVNGLVTLGSAIFTIALPFVIKFLLQSLGLSNTLRALSSLQFIMILLTLTWKPILGTHHDELDHILSTESLRVAVTGCCTWTGKFLNVSIWKNRSYVIWVTSVALALFGYFVPFVHLVEYCKEKGLGENAEVFIICIGGVSGISRLISGKLADVKGMNRVRLQQVAFVIMGITTSCIPLASKFWHLVVITSIMGICDGIFVCLLGPIAFDIVGPKGASQAVGFLLGILSVPMTAGPPIAGILRDHLGTYSIPFYAAGVPPIIGALVMFAIPAVVQHYPHVTEAEEHQIMSLENLNIDSPTVIAAPYFGSQIWTKTESVNVNVPIHKSAPELFVNGTAPGQRHRVVSLSLTPTVITDGENRDLVENGNDDESAI